MPYSQVDLGSVPYKEHLLSSTRGQGTELGGQGRFGDE